MRLILATSVAQWQWLKCKIIGGGTVRLGLGSRCPWSCAFYYYCNNLRWRTLWAIAGGGTAFPRVPLHFNHCSLVKAILKILLESCTKLSYFLAESARYLLEMWACWGTPGAASCQWNATRKNEPSMELSLTAVTVSKCISPTDRITTAQNWQPTSEKYSWFKSNRAW